jgi:spoIIIJ-associated protein
MTRLVVSGKTIDEAIARGLTELQVPRDRVDVSVLEQPSKGFLGFGSREAKVELTVKMELTTDRIEEKVVIHNAQTAIDTITEARPGEFAGSVEVDVNAREDEDVPAGNALNREIPAAGELIVSEGEADVEPLSLDEALSAGENFLLDVTEAMGLAIALQLEETEEGFIFTIESEDELGMLIGRRGHTLDALQYLCNIVANRYSDAYLRIILDAENFRARRQETLEVLADRLAGKVYRTHRDVVLEPMSAHERKIIHSHLQSNNNVRTYSKGEEPRRCVVITYKH